MSVLPAVRVGAPVRHESLSVFPLFTEPLPAADYLLSDEALAGGGVQVQELNEAGSVPELIVDNQTDSLVLFLEGEELRGAKQNRVLNTSVLVAAKSRTKIPVSCVEQGRWHYHSRHFGSAGMHSSSKLRSMLKGSVTASLRRGGGHRADQGKVWDEVERQMSCLGSSSATRAMSDTFDEHRPRLAEFQDRLGYVEGATGLAVAVGDRVVALDLFDRPTTCQKVWRRLLTGVVLDSLEAPAEGAAPEPAAVEALVGQVENSPWQAAKAVGVGEELRSNLARQGHASVLALGGIPVHASVVA
jgi:hypothetical protein